MHVSSLSTTAVEKLKQQAKRHRLVTGEPLAQSQDFVAKQAGLSGWKEVTVLASRHIPHLMGANHNWLTHWVDDSISSRQHRCASVEELCDRLGGVQPVLLRSHCDKSRPHVRCLCELDPFMTAKRANVRIDIGDKHDSWSYLYLADEPFRAPTLLNVRVNLGLSSHGHYIHEHLFDDTGSHDDRANSLNPNNRAHLHSLNNRSVQLNPKSERI